MCQKCKSKWGSTKHLLYWQAEWFKRFLLTWYHIFNRKAYHTWQAAKEADRVFDIVSKRGLGIDEGMRFELDNWFDGRKNG